MISAQTQELQPIIKYYRLIRYLVTKYILQITIVQDHIYLLNFNILILNVCINYFDHIKMKI
jgi:hypothetical protein